MSHRPDRSLLVALTAAVSTVTAVAGLALLVLWIGALFGGAAVSVAAVAALFVSATTACVVVLAGTVIDWMAPAVRWVRLLVLSLLTPVIPIAAIGVGAFALHQGHKRLIVGFLVFAIVVVALSAAWSRIAATVSVRWPNGTAEADSTR